MISPDPLGLALTPGAMALPIPSEPTMPGVLHTNALGLFGDPGYSHISSVHPILESGAPPPSHFLGVPTALNNNIGSPLMVPAAATFSGQFHPSTPTNSTPFVPVSGSSPWGSDLLLALLRMDPRYAPLLNYTTLPGPQASLTTHISSIPQPGINTPQQPPAQNM